jgi:hypothetical protein
MINFRFFVILTHLSTDFNNTIGAQSSKQYSSEQIEANKREINKTEINKSFLLLFYKKEVLSHPALYATARNRARRFAIGRKASSRILCTTVSN